MFFRNFPKTLYSFDIKNDSPTVVTNIFSRFSFNSAVLNNTYAYYRYQLQEGDTPEIVADKVYGDPTLHWIICMTNDVIDAQFDFPLSTNALETYIVKKYSYTSIANAYSEIHHYEYQVEDILEEVNGPTTVSKSNSVVTLAQYNFLTDKLDNKVINLPVSETINFRANNADANSSIVSTLTKTSVYKPVYVYDYENKLNEDKRELKILKREYIDSVILEMEKVLNE